MYLLPVITLAGLVAASPYPFPNNTELRREAAAPATSACDSPGASLCNGQESIGLCAIDNMIVWQQVAAGTICFCPTPGACIQGFPTSNAPTGSQSAPAPSSMPVGTAPPGSTPPSSTSVSAPGPSSPSGGGTYQVYKGDGSVGQGWPSMDDWVTFEDMWNGYLPIIGKDCNTLYTPVRDNTQTETENIKKALQIEAEQGSVPSNFAFAIMMQESKGCVAVATTDNGVQNPGIFQAYNGKGSCFNTSNCTGTDCTQTGDCSMSQVQQMAKDGICGTPLASGQGFQKGLQQDYADPQVASASEDAQKWYRVARLYNSGSIDPQNLDDGFSSTNCYVMDVANRVTGQWYIGNTLCNLDAI